MFARKIKHKGSFQRVGCPNFLFVETVSQKGRQFYIKRILMRVWEEMEKDFDNGKNYWKKKHLDGLLLLDFLYTITGGRIQKT